MGIEKVSSETRLALASYDAGDAAKAFKFEPRRARLDWRLLSAIDVDRLARETDIDSLEQALDTVTFGDVTVEDPRLLTGTQLLDYRVSCVHNLRACENLHL